MFAFCKPINEIVVVDWYVTMNIHEGQTRQPVFCNSRPYSHVYRLAEWRNVSQH